MQLKLRWKPLPRISSFERRLYAFITVLFTAACAIAAGLTRDWVNWLYLIPMLIGLVVIYWLGDTR